MAQVDVTINGRDYQIACDDGQEDHLAQLGEYVDRRVKELATTVGQVGDSRLLVMVSLLIADELAETYAELKKASTVAENSVSAEQVEKKLVEIVDAAAARIETVTDSISVA
jgi:cell division protein ZapA|tara:strand:- start:323 stop:658 length:336 start_codon:yes stop_codon:yes gene_type:complete